MFNPDPIAQLAKIQARFDSRLPYEDPEPRTEIIEVAINDTVVFGNSTFPCVYNLNIEVTEGEEVDNWMVWDGTMTITGFDRQKIPQEVINAWNKTDSGYHSGLSDEMLDVIEDAVLEVF